MYKTETGTTLEISYTGCVNKSDSSRGMKGLSTGYGPFLTPSGSYDDGYSYSQYSPRSGSVTPVVDDEISHRYSDATFYVYYCTPIFASYTNPVTRLRVEQLERQLASLTGMVQQAMRTGKPLTAMPDFLGMPLTSNSGGGGGGGPFLGSSGSSSPRTGVEQLFGSELKPPKLGRDKSVSFEKSVSFSDEPDLGSPKHQHSPLHAADKPAKPAIKFSTLPRSMYSQAVGLRVSLETYNHLRALHKKAKALRIDFQSLQRLAQGHAMSMREVFRDGSSRIRLAILSNGDKLLLSGASSVANSERLRVSRDTELFKQEMHRLESDLGELETNVEELRSNVINRRSRVNMSDVESMAVILSKASKMVADLKSRFPMLSDNIKTSVTMDMEKAVQDEKFLKEEPDRLDGYMRRCKKLTGTLVTLKRQVLASVQEQRLPGTNPGGPLTPASAPPTTIMHQQAAATPGSFMGTESSDVSAKSLRNKWKRSALFRDTVSAKDFSLILEIKIAPILPPAFPSTAATRDKNVAAFEENGRMTLDDLAEATLGIFAMSH
ncbi:unnamed protein product [Notodromas monacha]|uniref:Uncharacterized protein n=1 Tax=Notodromas monacha TaxID=399045 RepID=A0A7R9BRF7_9CRUS|nr:unnamed protein product [Notodromas monacha]CAG0919247.1 unnamed protein product [Notodromas monacha]